LSFIDARDIADAACAALTSARHEGRAYTLTGPEAIDHGAVARAIAAAAGRPPEAIAPFTTRPPLVPTELGLLAGRAKPARRRAKADR
jgi:uncharacterized protein YbjT (DUF2867 family)